MKDNFQLNYSKLKPSMYNEKVRIKKAEKTIAVLKDYFKEVSSLTLLDIGSSTGIMTNEYAKNFKTVIGVDLDTTAIDYSINQYKSENIKFICSPIEELDLPSSSLVKQFIPFYSRYINTALFKYAIADCAN